MVVNTSISGSFYFLRGVVCGVSGIFLRVSGIFLRALGIFCGRKSIVNTVNLQLRKFSRRLRKFSRPLRKYSRPCGNIPAKFPTNSRQFSRQFSQQFSRLFSLTCKTRMPWCSCSAVLLCPSLYPSAPTIPLPPSVVLFPTFYPFLVEVCEGAREIIVRIMIKPTKCKQISP